MNKIIKIYLWAIAFTPLMMDNSVFFPSVTGESIFMRGFLFLICIFFTINFFYKRQFRKKIIEKIKIFIKNPLFISILAFILIFIISTIFSIDKYSAFWGNADRAEGLVGIIYFFSFFIFSILVFEKKDWLWFFRLSLVVSSVLLLKEFIQFSDGLGRPGSFTNNPTFLAGYLLFSIFCAIIVFKGILTPREITGNRRKYLFLMGWKYFSIGIFILSILGIFIAQTRGTILGLVVGFVSVLIYGIFKGKDVFYKKLNLRRLSIIFLCFLFIFSCVFVLTRKNEMWQKVPGLGRVAAVNSEDITIQTRLLMTKLSIKAVNPIENGWKKFLIGWGPENFSLAYSKYFSGEQYKYEVGWFDRSHNKLLDALVMNGLIGLIAYLSIYFFFFKAIFKRKDFSLFNIGLIFFGVSLLVHLLFVFDQATTSIPFFAVLAFVLCLIGYNNIEKETKENKRKYETDKTEGIFTGIFFSALALFICFVFVRNDLSSYIQMKKYGALREKSDPKIMSEEIDKVFEPFTVAQASIRDDFLVFVSKNYDANNEFIVKLFNTSIIKAEEYVNRAPFDLRFLAHLAEVYSNKGNELNNPIFLKKGEECIRKVLIYAPNRPDFNFDLALNLFYQQRYKESFNYFEKVLDINPSFLPQNGKIVQNIYPLFFQYFYIDRDKDNFIKTIKRLEEYKYTNAGDLDGLIEYMEKNNTWPNINFTP